MPQPLDIFSLPEDLDAWRKSFSYPLPLRANQAFFKSVGQAVRAGLDSCPPGEKGLFRIASVYLVHALSNLVCQCVVAGHQPEGGWRCDGWRRNQPRKKENDILRLAEGRMPVSFFSMDPPARQSSWTDPLRGRWASFTSGYHTPSWLADTVVVAPNDTTVRYLDQSGSGRRYLVNPLEVLKCPPAEALVTERAYWSGFVTSLLDHIKTLIRDAGGIWPVGIEEEVQRRYLHALGTMRFDLECARSYAKRFRAGVPVVTGTGGNYLVRLLGIAFSERNSRVMSTPHGGGLACGNFCQQIIFGEMGCCTHYLCLHPAEALEYGKYALMSPVEFVIAKGLDRSLVDLEEFKRNVTVRKDISGINNILFVMLTGLESECFADCLPSDLVQLDLQIEVISRLLDLGKRVTIKNRPKTAYLGKEFNHFGYFGDRVEYTCRPMADVIPETELFVFQMIGSFSLYEAMTMSNAPVVLLDTGIPDPTDSFRQVEDARLHRLPLFDDGRGRFRFADHDFHSLFGKGKA